MKKTIRIIDLLNMISKGEEVPKKIRHFGEEFKLAKDNEYYSVYSSNPLISYFGEDYLRAELNDEVEILDEEEFEDIEEEKEIELYKIYQDYLENNFTVNMANIISDIEAIFNETNDKINKLIKNQKKIIEKLNKEK